MGRNAEKHCLLDMTYGACCTCELTATVLTCTRLGQEAIHPGWRRAHEAPPLGEAIQLRVAGRGGERAHIL